MENAAVKPAFFALSAAALFGVSTPCAKVLLGGVGPITLAALLYLGSGIGLGLLALLPGRPETGITRADLPWLACSVLAGGVLAPVVLMTALAVTPAATASLLLTVETAATALIALLIFGEPVGRRAGAAVVLVTLAAAILSWEGHGNYGFSAGALGVVFACVLWGLDNNLTARISAKDPVVITAVKGVGAGLFSLTLAAVMGEALPALLITGPALVLGFVSYGLSLVLFVMAVRGMGAARTSALYTAAPFMGVIFSVAALGERGPTPSSSRRFLSWESGPSSLSMSIIVISTVMRLLLTITATATTISTMPTPTDPGKRCRLVLSTLIHTTMTRSNIPIPTFPTSITATGMRMRTENEKKGFCRNPLGGHLCGGLAAKTSSSRLPLVVTRKSATPSRSETCRNKKIFDLLCVNREMLCISRILKFPAVVTRKPMVFSSSLCSPLEEFVFSTPAGHPPDH